MKARTRLLIIIPGLILLGLFVWYFSAIIVYLVVAAVLTLMGRPIINVLAKVKIRGKDLPDALNAVITLLVLFSMFSLIFIIFIPPLIQQTNKVEEVLEIDPIAQGLKNPISTLERLNQDYNFIPEDKTVMEYLRENAANVLNSVKISNVVRGVVNFTGDFIIAIFSISFIAFFFLKERGLMHQIVITLSPSTYREQVNNILDSIKRLLTRYFIGVVAEIILVGTLITIGLGILGIENAFVIGFFAGLFNVIPYLGPIIGGILGVTFAVLGVLGTDFNAVLLPLALKVLVVFIVVQLIDNFVFQPFIYSSSVKAHPLEIFLVILMAGNLAGVGGMILAIPVYTILRVIAKEFFNQFELVQSITKSI